MQYKANPAGYRDLGELDFDRLARERAKEYGVPLVEARRDMGVLRSLLVDLVRVSRGEFPLHYLDGFRQRGKTPKNIVLRIVRRGIHTYEKQSV